VTAILARYTFKLFRAAQEAHKDSQKAIAVAEQNAAAATESADTAMKSMELTLRAFVVVSEPRITSFFPRSHIPKDIKIIVANVGQTPALDAFGECTVGIESLQVPDVPQLAGYEHGDQVKKLLGTIGHSHASELQILLDQQLFTRHEAGLTFDYRQILLRGSITYKDFITHSPRRTDFNYIWRASTGEFRATETVGNTMT
jgi:hypothetical protein